MNNSEIVHESLDCILAKTKDMPSIYLLSVLFMKIFKDKSIIDDFKLLIDKFWESIPFGYPYA